MYCPKCELEIKGEEKETCPICESPLTESPFEEIAASEEGAEEDLKLKELIDDIDEKVKKNLEESVEESSLDLKLGDEEPGENEFKLELEDHEPEVPMDKSEESAFDLTEQEKPAAGEEQVVRPDDGIAAEAEGAIEAEEPLKVEPSEESLKLEGGVGLEKTEEQEEPGEAVPEEPVTEEAPQEPEVKMEEVLAEEPKADLGEELAVDSAAGQDADAEEQVAEPISADAGISTQEILDKALDDLDSDADEILPPKEKSAVKSLPVVLGIVALFVVVVGAGFYYLNLRTEPTTTVPSPKVKVAKKDDKVLKEILKKDRVALKKPAKPAAGVTLKESQAVAKKKVPEKTAAVKTKSVVTAKKVEKPLEKALPVETVKQRVLKEEKPPVRKVIIKKEAPAAPTFTYAIHAGSFRKEKIAEGEALRFKDKGFDAYVERTDLSKLGKKGIWYRVKIGRFNSREEAKKVQKEFNRKSKIRSRIIKNRP